MATTATKSNRAGTLDQLLKPKEAAGELGVCVHTLRSLVLKGEIKSVRMGKRAVRYRSSDIARIQAQGVAV